MCERAVPHFVNYVFFDTGIEYQATKEHLNWLEQKYGIEIHREKAKVPVPLGNKKYGVPFLSKYASDMISRLQRHGFKWEDKDFDTLYREYPRCKGALLWWTNSGKRFNIQRNTWLKEFLIKNPPTFTISPMCCNGAKKNPAKSYFKTNNINISIVGVRRAEGGIRATSYKDYVEMVHGIEQFKPLLFVTDADRKEYEQEFNIAHSNCYTEYGLIRTGCAGCPFGREYQCERDIIKQYEPKLSKAIENMWGEVYEYTNKYHEFQKIMNLKYKSKKKCSCGCNEFEPDTVAMNLKIFGREGDKMLCKECFKKEFHWSDERWNNEIDKFKSQGCDLF